MAWAVVFVVGCNPATETNPLASEEVHRMRIALFNVKELSAAKLAADPSSEAAKQVEAAVAIIVRVNPDVLVVQEIDQGSDDDPASVARLLADRLRVKGIDYPHVFSAPSNTGRLTGIDFDGDGTVATTADEGTREHGNDAFGFGTYPGQYSMAVLSRRPFDLDRVRTFQRFLWTDLPGHHIDTDLDASFLSPEAREIFRLSSKSHWDLPVLTGSDPSSPIIRLLISHPTPPVFDGPEDRNGRRNFDEIKFWAEYLNDNERLTDDNGRRGGFTASSQLSDAGPEHASRTGSFVLIGDLNAYPQATAESGGAIYDGRTAISQLLEHPLVIDSGSWLTSQGALVHAGAAAGGPAFKEQATAGFGSGTRIDYLLPSHDIRIEQGGVFWPDPTVDSEGADLAQLASDHRLVWLDVEVSGR